MTPGDAVNASSETRDPCLGNNSVHQSLPTRVTAVTSLAQSAFLDSMEDDDQQDV